jgi:glyoxylase-like metal-dependent hydrolase (beta-lactamase superfamily II)
VGDRSGDELFVHIGSRPFGKWTFDFRQGKGGHVRGETVIVCDALKLLFSGDIYVNIRGFSDEQREFNSLAPFLMTGVETDSALCRQSREELLRRYPGYLFVPGHGPAEQK